MLASSLQAFGVLQAWIDMLCRHLSWEVNNDHQEGRSSRRHAHGRGTGKIEKPPDLRGVGGFEVSQI